VANWLLNKCGKFRAKLLRRFEDIKVFAVGSFYCHTVYIKCS